METRYPEKPVRVKRQLFVALMLLILCGLQTACKKRAITQPAWPEVKTETRPWTRWWWMGSSVDTANLGELLRNYKSVGLGGVEITPIYGVKGEEKNFIPYLSDAWLDRLEYTLDKASDLGMGVDMATGTGWPFGGPWVQKEDASKYLAHKTYHLSTGESLSQKIEFVQRPFVRSVNTKVNISELVRPIAQNKNLQALALDQVRFEEKLPLVCLMAYPENGEPLNITEKVDAKGNLSWTAPEGNWTLYALFAGWHGKMVERAAPGGEGWVIDHFSETALNNYLAEFDTAFKGRNIGSIRAFFNDSYEVDDARGQANWTPDFFVEFKKRRRYDLRDFLPALWTDETTEMNARVLSDFRLTISELLLEKFTLAWSEWAHKYDAKIRNQSHGSPANLLDLYAVSDIPETEGEDVLRFKFASSAAHITGKKLVSAETATWLNGHFKSSLGDIQQTINNLFLGGVNHICYHGTNYSPKNAAWPGWLFYASVHFSPSNPFWNDFKTLNDYVTRCQSFLQKGSPYQDLLVYMPIFDRFAETGGNLIQHFDGMKGWDNTAFKSVSENLLSKGYAFDFVSDKQISTLQIQGQKLVSSNSSYRTLLVPTCKWLPLNTFKQLVKLAENGATVIWQGTIPLLTPGLQNYKQRQDSLQAMLSQIHFNTISEGLNEAKIGQGRFLMGKSLNTLMRYAEINPEPMVSKGLGFVRRKDAEGIAYFVVNKNDKPFKGWLSLHSKGKSVAMYNPMNADMGLLPLDGSEENSTKVFVNLNAGQSTIIKVYANKLQGEMYPFMEPVGDELVLNGQWNVQFLKGGSVKPPSFTTDSLLYWTELSSDEAKYFSGQVAYSLHFSKPKIDFSAQYWMLDIGAFRKSASVWLNGKKVGTIINAAQKLRIADSLLLAQNQLEIRVSNGMGNRIIQMERQGENWKKFYNINFSARFAENRNDKGLFDASDWKIPVSGLKGPVTLRPVKIFKTKPIQ